MTWVKIAGGLLVVFFLIVVCGSLIKIVNFDELTNDNYTGEANIYQKKYFAGRAFKDSVEIYHKFKGNYVFVISTISDDFEKEYRRYNEFGKYDSASALETRIPHMLLNKHAQLKFVVKDSGRECVRGIFGNFRLSSTGKKGPEMGCFVYNVPKQIPQNRRVVLEYEIANWDDEVFSNVDTAVVNLSIVRGK
jgi:hypothetical protein